MIDYKKRNEWMRSSNKVIVIINSNDAIRCQRINSE
jgi:hypothetical protein